MASVDIAGVYKSYGPLEVIHGIDVKIADGAFVVLVGPSGCGKSTLLRMVAGLEDFSEGEIRIGDRVVNSVPSKDRDIAMVFQNYALYPHMKVFDNMGFSLKLRKSNRTEIGKRVKIAAEILGLTPLLDRYPRQLSGGQRQRVAMGRAIVRDPKVFLFDEPLSNLDAQLRMQMRSEIKLLHRRLGTTSIYVTHDQVEAMTMGDRIVVIESGTVAQMGPPLEVYDRPANLFVAGFIGSPPMNFIEGVVKAADGQVGFVADDGTELPVQAGSTAVDGQRVVYGIRPEHFVLGSTDDAFSAEVVTVEPTGAEELVACKLAQTDVKVLFKERQSLSPGETIMLRPTPGHVHLFDAATRARVT